MRVRFWGVRGSCPAPVTTDDVRERLLAVLREYNCTRPNIDLSNSEAVTSWLDTLPQRMTGIVGSNTPCIELRTKHNDLFIIDLGSGVRVLGNHLLKSEFGQGKGLAHIFLSHFHWDHIQGWPFFKPAYIPGNRFEMYTRHKHMRARLKRQQESPFFPPAAWDSMRATINWHNLDDTPKVLCDGRIRVSCLELDHPSKSYAYRFEADNRVFVYASDSAYRRLDDVSLKPFIDFYRDADLLIFDAQFSLTESFEKRSWGHSSAQIGVEIACQANVKQMALFHHDPDADDAWLEHLLDTAQHYSSNVPAVHRRRPNQVHLVVAREGLEIEL